MPGIGQTGGVQALLVQRTGDDAVGFPGKRQINGATEKIVSGLSRRGADLRNCNAREIDARRLQNGYDPYRWGNLVWMGNRMDACGRMGEIKSSAQPAGVAADDRPAELEELRPGTADNLGTDAGDVAEREQQQGKLFAGHDGHCIPTPQNRCVRANR